MASAGITRSGRFDGNGQAGETLDLPSGAHTIVALVTADGETSELARELVTIAATGDGSDEASAIPVFLALGALGGGGYWWWRRRQGRAGQPEALATADAPGPPSEPPGPPPGPPPPPPGA